MTHRPSPERQLIALYAELPTIECKGHCANTCTSFPVPRVEKRRIRRHTGVDFGPSIKDPRKTKCPLLDPDRLCAAHSVRPLICRLWGVSAAMPCQFGCRPSRLLTVAETHSYMARLYEINGQTKEAALWREAARKAEASGLLDDPAVEKGLKMVAWGKITPAQFEARVLGR